MDDIEGVRMGVRSVPVEAQIT